MTTIADARLAIQEYLVEMNLSPYEVRITSYDATKQVWIIQGQFQAGFLGDILAFNALFDPQSNVINKLDILRDTGSDSI